MQKWVSDSKIIYIHISMIDSPRSLLRGIIDPVKDFFILCSLIPLLAAGNVLTGIQCE